MCPERFDSGQHGMQAWPRAVVDGVVTRHLVMGRFKRRVNLLSAGQLAAGGWRLDTLTRQDASDLLSNQTLYIRYALSRRGNVIRGFTHALPLNT